MSVADLGFHAEENLASTAPTEIDDVEYAASTTELKKSATDDTLNFSPFIFNRSHRGFPAE